LRHRWPSDDPESTPSKEQLLDITEGTEPPQYDLFEFRGRFEGISPMRTVLLVPQETPVEFSAQVRVVVRHRRRFIPVVAQIVQLRRVIIILDIAPIRRTNGPHSLFPDPGMEVGVALSEEGKGSCLRGEMAENNFPARPLGVATLRQTMAVFFGLRFAGIRYAEAHVMKVMELDRGAAV